MPKKKKISNVKTRAPKVSNVHPDLEREKNRIMSNGLSDALNGGWNPTSIGTQLNQTETLFRNNRWYMISNMRQLLSEVYVEHGLIQAICQVPVADGLRGGIEIKTKMLSEEELLDLQTTIERQNDIGIAGESAVWNRLFGGAGIIIITDQDPASPLDMDAIGEDTPLEYRAVDMWELFWDQQNIEGYNVELQSEVFEHYSYYGTKLHKSRVLALKGMTAPSFVRPRLRGWGFSVVEALVNSINQYLKSNNLTFEVLDEFKLDIYRLKNLATTLLEACGEETVRRRVQMTNAQKNFQNAIVLDSEDEYQQKQLSFAGIADMMKEFRMQIASDMRMPITKLFGTSAQGFSSGEDDIENYNAMVEAQVREKLKFHILRMVEIRCQKLFGMVPDDLSIDFKPLRILSAEQEENCKTQVYNRLMQAKSLGEITSLEFRNAINKADLFPIQLETSEEALNDVTTEAAEDAQIGNPEGANAPDSQMSEKAAPTSKSVAKDAPVAKNSTEVK